jgi:uncharacterized protein
VQLSENKSLVVSPSDLSAFLSCPHLTSLQLAVARGELEKPYRPNPYADLIHRKGEEHETSYLEWLRDEGREVVEIAFDYDWEAAAHATEDAIAASVELVYQACLLGDDWRGFADFLELQPSGRYEVVDTKLARRARPAHILQLCFYTEEVARLQGAMPEAMHVVNGLGERESFRPADFLAYYHRLRARFQAAIESGGATYPYPVDHCGLCDFFSLCRQRWEDDDHLTLVAGISRAQVERLTAADVSTLTELGDADPDMRIPKLNPVTFDKLRDQAGLQLHRRRTGEHRVHLLPIEPERGLALLPEPQPGDIWLDFEGYPWFEPAQGLEYLVGWVYLDDEGRPQYDSLWARDRAEEKREFEELIDLIVERRRRFPGMHVYHYAPYERTALQRLTGYHATRAEELDDLLRGHVLVDLFRVTKQALRASVSSYSIKNVEELYGFERTADVSGGTESVKAFEQWLEVGDDALLDGIRAYNEEDCVSLYELHLWLLGQRPTDLPWCPTPEAREPSEEAAEQLAERQRVQHELLDGAEEGEPRWLLAHLLGYHRAEEKPQWWEYFHHKELDPEELLEDRDTIGGLELVGEPEPNKQSLVYTFAFPPQEHKIGGRCEDPHSEKGYDVDVDDELGRVTLRRAKRRADEPLPVALIPRKPLQTYTQRDAVLRFAQAPDNHPALVEILERRPPRARLDGTLADAASSLDGSYLFVQGPPGSGKTWNGARMAIALMHAGRRVGVTALSHRAINKFLDDVGDAAREVGFSFKGRKKADDVEDCYEDEFIDCRSSNDDMLDEELHLIAGTSWLFSRPDQSVDTLFIDEGGQFALADALAVGTAAHNLILLGDPNQLAQVTQGTHPAGAGVSVLTHLLGEEETVRDGMGIFLERTWRLRPEVNDFISPAFYEGRLQPAEAALHRALGTGNGLRFVPIDHEGNRAQAPEEAQYIRDAIAGLLGTRYVDEDGERRLRADDVIVVAPYNAQVRCLRQAIPDREVRIGTVDKFQGQQAVVVFYSMASSSGDDVPRGLDFLFSRNRLNVAISRAKCLACLVASPRLLEASCKTIEQMRMANALCLFVEEAEGVERVA